MSRGEANGNADANEHTPLLKDQPSQVAHGPIEPAEGTVEDASHGQNGGVPLAEEPSTAKLVVILGSTYFGIFLAALGRSIAHVNPREALLNVY